MKKETLFILSVFALSAGFFTVTSPAMAKQEQVKLNRTIVQQVVKKRWSRQELTILKNLISGNYMGLADGMGAGSSGGGNTVKGELFDDYENKGSVLLTKKEVRAHVNPYLASVKKKLPVFAAKLKKGIAGRKWYLEPKPLKQFGGCKNASMLSVNPVVSACQSKLSVRINLSLFEQNKRIRSPIMLHELLVYQQIEKNRPNRLNVITDEGVREISRTIRDPSVSAKELQQALIRTNFGAFLTVEQRKTYASHVKNVRNAECTYMKKSGRIVGTNRFRRSHINAFKKARKRYYDLLEKINKYQKSLPKAHDELDEIEERFAGSKSPCSK